MKRASWLFFVLVTLAASGRVEGQGNPVITPDFPLDPGFEAAALPLDPVDAAAVANALTMLRACIPVFLFDWINPWDIDSLLCWLRISLSIVRLEEASQRGKIQTMPGFILGAAFARTAPDVTGWTQQNGQLVATTNVYRPGVPKGPRGNEIYLNRFEANSHPRSKAWAVICGPYDDLERKVLAGVLVHEGLRLEQDLAFPAMTHEMSDEELCATLLPYTLSVKLMNKFAATITPEEAVETNPSYVKFKYFRAAVQKSKIDLEALK